MRVAVVAAAICLSVVGLSAADDSKAAIRKDTSIPAQGLAPALQTLAKTYDFQVLYRTEVVGDLRTQGAVGTMTAPEALKQVLSGTGLSFKYLDENTVTILPASAGSSQEQSAAPPPTSQDAAKEGKKSSSGGFRVAQVDQGQTSRPSTVEKPDEQASKKKPVELEEVVVTGSRIPTVAGQNAQDVKVYTRENIEQSGQTNVGDFFNTLPSVSISNTANLYQSGNGTGSTVQLHGLPVGTTLVLINGRRVETSGSQQNTNFFDLNNIPLAAIERVEVVPEGSSAVYGSDAIAGVVNIILKDNFDGLEANVKYASASGTDETNGSLAWGGRWDKGSVSVIASLESQSALLGSKRALTASNDYRAYGGPNNNFPTCTPGNIFSTNGGNLPGLNAPYAAVPAGFNGTPTIQEFSATAGTLNECTTSAYTSYIPTTHRQALLLNGNYDLTPAVRLFAEVLYSHVTVDVDLGPQSAIFAFPGFQSFTVSASNPFNPFGQTVGVAELTPPEFINALTTDYVRPTIGAKGSLFDKWSWEAAAWDSQDRSSQSFTQLNGPAVQAAFNSSNPATALNPFVAGPPGSPQLLQSLSYSATTVETGQILGASGFVRGPLLQLPSGALELVLGAEYNYDRLHVDSVTTALFSSPATTYHRDTYAVFGESRIPLLANHADSLAHNVLALTVAGRYDHYNDFGGKTTPQLGLEWRPVETLLVRGTNGKAFKAPSLSNLNSPINTSQGTVQDPLRGNQAESVAITHGGNPSLRPETGESKTLGFIYSSQYVPGLQVAATYWDVKESDHIQIVDLATLVKFESQFPGFIVRAPSCSGGPPCPIVQVNDQYLNFGDIKTAGFDFGIKYTYESPVGQFITSLNATETERYTVSLKAGSPAVDSDSIAQDTGNWAPRWKGTAALSWKRGPYTAAIDGRYVGRYQDYDRPNKIGNFWISDANVRIGAAEALGSNNAWLKDSYLTVGAVNIFNKLPQYSSYFFSFAGYDPAQGDLRGRFLYVQLGVKY